MNISLLISGNLTGFGRFFTSPAAKELLGTDKIDLDNHNHISFLGDNEKAYSITFAQRYIAVSLYTRILDSFRRPGELVVTLLIPRNQIIVPNSGSSIGAVYSLLNKVCDKFFEKNFQDGMINQNPVVLGQDYYSEILDNYRLKPMSMREVNPNPSSVKKVGYVKAQETDIPKYLDTPCRESYNDHNLIIIAQSAPVGIDEEPEEVILYSIHIKNNGATLPGRVKLTSPIYKYQAQAGEKPFPIQGSYKDAVDHLLEPRITARMMPNDVVEISYNFEKEEKTVNFIFLDKNTGAPISIDVVQPSVVIDGAKLPISSETFTFRGSEIHVSKKLVSDNSNYTISKRSEILDLSRIGNNQDLKVYVEQGFMLAETFPKPHDYKKTFVFINKSNGQRETFYVTDRANIHLSGTISDWDFMMDSENFSVPQQTVRTINGHWYIQVKEKPKVKVNTPQTPATISSSNHTVAVQKKNSGHDNSSISLTGGETSDHTTPHNRKLSYKKLAMIIVPLLCILGGVGYLVLKNQVQDDTDSGGEGGIELYAYGAYICYYDDTPDISKRDTLTVDQIKQLPLIISFLESDSDEKLDNNKYYTKNTILEGNNQTLYLQKFTNKDRNNAYENFKIRVEYEYDGKRYRIVDENIHIEKKENENLMDTIGVNLQILMSQLDYFDKLTSFKDKKFKNQNEKNVTLNEIDKINNEEIKRFLKTEFDRIGVKEGDPQSSTGDFPRQETIRLDDLSRASFNFANLSKYKKYENKILGDGATVKDRIAALEEANTWINKKGYAQRPTGTGLSNEQQKAIENTFKASRLSAIKSKTKGKKFKSIADLQDFVNKLFDN